MIAVQHHGGGHALDLLHDSVYTDQPFLNHLFMHLLQVIITAAEGVREHHACWMVEPVLIIVIRVGEDQLVEGS